MAETLIIISLSIVISRAVKAGLISQVLRDRLAGGAEVDLLREITLEMAVRDRNRADGLEMIALELEAAGGWARAWSAAPGHARETWTATVDLLRSR